MITRVALGACAGVTIGRASMERVLASTATGKVTGASCFPTVWSLQLGIVFAKLTMLSVRDYLNAARAGLDKPCYSRFDDTADRESVSLIHSVQLASPLT